MSDDGAGWEMGVDNQEANRIISEHLVLADLPVFRREKKLQMANSEIQNEPVLRGILGVDIGKINSQREWERFKKTNMEKLGGMIDTFVVEHPEVMKRLGIKTIDEADPATAATFCLEMVAQTMQYAYEIVPGMEAGLSETERQRIDDLKKNGGYEQYLKAEEKKYDEMSSDQLLENKRGVCRHYAAAAMAVYENLKTRAGGKLDGTFLAYVDSLERYHAFDMFLQIGPEKTNLALADPTWYVGKNGIGELKREERFTDERVVTVARTLNHDGLREGLHLSREELAGIVQKQIDGMGNSIVRGGINRESDIQRYLELTDEVGFLMQGENWDSGVGVVDGCKKLLVMAASWRQPALLLADVVWSKHLKDMGWQAGVVVDWVKEEAAKMKEAGKLPGSVEDEIELGLGELYKRIPSLRKQN